MSTLHICLDLDEILSKRFQRYFSILPSTIDINSVAKTKFTKSNKPFHKSKSNVKLISNLKYFNFLKTF